jgi:hypothetical protein
MTKKLTSSYFFAFLALLTFGSPNLGAEPKKGYFQRFKESIGGAFTSAKNKASGFVGSAKKGVANKVSSCGTNCANGQVGMEALSYCAFTHSRVPVCMKKLVTELENYKKHLKEKPQDSSANLSKLMNSYFDVMPISRDILLQMAKQRKGMETKKEYANVLMILKHYYKPVILSHFFQTSNKYYEETAEKVVASHAHAHFVGYIFHVDGASVAAKGQERMAYGFVLHTPSRSMKASQNFTGTLFKVPYEKAQRAGLTNPKNKLVTFSNLERMYGANKHITITKKTKMGNKKYRLPITSKTTHVLELGAEVATHGAPPVHRHTKPARFKGHQSGSSATRTSGAHSSLV